jgi:hypothetical protein
METKGIRRANGPHAAHHAVPPHLSAKDKLRTDAQHAAHHAVLVRVSVGVPCDSPLPWVSHGTSEIGGGTDFVECQRVGGERKTLPSLEFRNACAKRMGSTRGGGPGDNVGKLM